jgi:hypothetical protein
MIHRHIQIFFTVHKPEQLELRALMLPLQFEERIVHERLTHKSKPLNPRNFTWLDPPPEDTSPFVRQLPDGTRVAYMPTIFEKNARAETRTQNLRLIRATP